MAAGSHQEDQVALCMSQYERGLSKLGSHVLWSSFRCSVVFGM